MILKLFDVNQIIGDKSDEKYRLQYDYVILYFQKCVCNAVLLNDRPMNRFYFWFYHTLHEVKWRDGKRNMLKNQ